MTLVCSLLLEDFSSVVLNISADPPRRQRLSQILSVEMAAAIVGKEESAPSLVQSQIDACPSSPRNHRKIFPICFFHDDSWSIATEKLSIRPRNQRASNQNCGYGLRVG